MTKLLKTLFVFAVTMVVSMAFGITANAEEIIIDNNTIQYTVSEGTVYWESSKDLGFGRHNTICEENQYTNINNGKFPVRINGYSFINQNGDIVNAYFDENTQKFSIPTTASEYELMVHIGGANGSENRLGWISFKDVNSKEDNSNYIISEIPEEKEEEWFDDSEEKTIDKTADTLKNNVEKDSEIPRKSYILADFSGSMNDFQTDVLEKLEGTSGKKYVFAEGMEEFFPGKDTWKYDIGGATDIANALNSVIISDDSHIYILSDLNDNCGTEIELNESFSGEITIVYYPSDYRIATGFMKRLREAYPNANITGF